MSRFVLALDQGTSSTRCHLLDHDGRVVASAQQEHTQHLPCPGWVEHDPLEILHRAFAVVTEALERADARPSDVVACGITNQRETAIAWDARTGEPVHPAIVWQDTRTDALCRRLGALGGGADRYRATTGLPLATYFTGPKWAWILDHVPGARARAEKGEVLLGTVDSWLVWHLTGGPDGGLHITDVTNASRTLLMDVRTLTWDRGIAAEMGVPVTALPGIRPSSEVYGTGHPRSVLPGVPIAAALGDQQAALFGQGCTDRGTAKNTYGTGSFLLVHTGHAAVTSRSGLLTTVAYQLSGRPACYALEGSIAVTGSLVHWLRDNLGLIDSAADIEPLAASVPDAGGCYLVPAFSGLFAPHWRPDARGALVGLTRYVTRAHLARAALEATCHQTREVVEAVEADIGVSLSELRVDGGMTVNTLLMQMQADVLGRPVTRAETPETTALGAAYAAGLAVGWWSGVDEVKALSTHGRTWHPEIDDDTRARGRVGWDKAVTRTHGWVETEEAS